MVVGLKMLTKMRLQELSKAMEKFRVKSPVQSASKRKGKEAIGAPSKKKKRTLILEDEDEEDEDPTIHALTRTRRSVSQPTELQKKQREEEEQTKSREEEEQREKEKEAEEEKEKSAAESGEKGNREHDHHSSPLDVLETGGVGEQERSTPHAADSEGPRQSPADPEEFQASQLPEEGDTSTPNLQDYTEAPLSTFTPSEKAHASTQTDNSADFHRIMDILLEMRGQIYALDCEIQAMKNAGQASSVTLEDKMKDLALQLQANAKGEEVAHLREDLKRLEGVVQSMGDFQIVRIPKQT